MTNEISAAQLQAFFALDWPKYTKALADVEKQKDEVCYNIVSVSTYSGHLENYHSDVWGFLLDPTAAHHKGDYFLSMFIDYLVANKLELNEYVSVLKDASVYREKGRIDVLIVNKKQKVCIIIENKINNAPDMDKQLERYREKAKKEGWKIAAMLYVSLTGERLSTVEDADAKVYAIAACNNSDQSLLKGWLIPAKDGIPFSKDRTDENIRSFLHQYCMLLQHLTADIMNNNANKVLYDTLSTKENFEVALLIANNLNSISLHRAEIIENALKNHFRSSAYHAPAFPKKSSGAGNDCILYYEHFKFEETTFILYVKQQKDITTFAFWSKGQKYSADKLMEVLTIVLGNHDFSANGHENQVGKTLSLAHTCQTLPEFDNSVVNYTIKLFTKFNQFATRPI